MSDHPYETGYRKPPRHRQFVKGTSGNPKGRPKGSKNFATMFQEVGHQKIKVTDNGVTREITKFEASAMQLLNKASTGDMRALNTLVTWMRLLQEVVEESEKPTPLASEADKAVIANIIKKIRDNDPEPEGSE
jgi:Family of unknown function (DUF5681)